MTRMIPVVAGCVALLLAVPSFSQEGRSGADPYPLETCPVSGGKLGSMGEPVAREYEGREVRFCCAGCIATFEKDKAASLKKVDEAIVRQQLPLYPLDTCLVSGGRLGEMGKPVELVLGNRLVRLCCAGCAGNLRKEPSKYLARLDAAAIARQKAGYPLKTCVVTGEKLGDMGEPVDHVFAGRLVRFCCKGCIGAFRKDPWKYMEKIGKAAHEKGDGAHGAREK